MIFIILDINHEFVPDVDSVERVYTKLAKYIPAVERRRVLSL